MPTMIMPRRPRCLAILSMLALASFIPAQESRPAGAVPAVPLVPLESRPASRPKKANIYDTKVDGKELVAAALKRAVKNDTRVLLVFGGNWCGWCHKLHDLFADNRELGSLLHGEYEVAWIDIGRNDRNQELVKTYVEKLAGVPHLTVLDSAGKVLTNQDTGALEDGDHHDPAKVEAFLSKWRIPAQDAAKVLADGIERAKADQKLVFLHFGAPWCGYCHKLEAFLARPEVAKILSQDFVMVKLDEDRMTGAKEIEKRMRSAKSDGIPWIAFLDASAAALATSDAPGGNIGCPLEPAEIDWFMGMLRKVRKQITPEQLAQLESSLREFAGVKAESRP